MLPTTTNERPLTAAVPGPLAATSLDTLAVRTPCQAQALGGCREPRHAPLRQWHLGMPRLIANVGESTRWSPPQPREACACWIKLPAWLFA